jgi:tetratricopeptide (TPR) repeat protein
MSRCTWILGGMISVGLAITVGPAEHSVAQTPPPVPAALGPICSAPDAPAALPKTVAQWAEGARLFAGFGNFHRQASTRSAEAQTYFDQGVRLLWAFNHPEAARSFANATRLDPQCAICYWGVSLAVGPNYNLLHISEQRALVAWEALQEAQKTAANADPKERALIAALAKRYSGPTAPDRGAAASLRTAYAEAMQAVARQFPEDLDLQVLAVEAALNVNAWNLWSLDGKPAPGTEESIAKLDSILAKDPQHPGANHYYVHAVEASPHPERGLEAARRLHGMMPGAGHLEHMPAHIYQRVGQYAAAAAASRYGIAADLAYFKETRPPEYYVLYTAHNYQFLTVSSAMEGRLADTLEAARSSRLISPESRLAIEIGRQWYVGEIYTGMIRFGLWDDILAEPAPDAKLPGLFGAYLYASASALAAKGRAGEARTRLGELEKLAADAARSDAAGSGLLRELLPMAVLTVRARIAVAENKRDDAIGSLREAVALEDRLAYDEPAIWLVPGRHLLGAVLLQAGQAAAAESVYRDDLARNAENGWALFGLARALEAQGKAAEAAAAQKRFETAWVRAEVKLTASAF